MEDLFTSEATNQAFNVWANPDMPPITYHPLDIERFYDFVHQFYENESDKMINEEEFVRRASAVCPFPYAEEMFTDYCRRANAIIGYLHYFKIKQNENK